MFPVYFDTRILSNAEDWFKQRSPVLSPIYIRNKVKVAIVNGEVTFFPHHEEFTLADGTESLLESDGSGWIKNYQLVVNPADWNDRKGEEGLKLLVSVDPFLPKQTAGLLADNADDIRKIRRDNAARRAFSEYHRQFEKKGEEILPVDFQKGLVMLTNEGGLLYSQGFSSGIARCEKSADSSRVYFLTLFLSRENGLYVGETSESVFFPENFFSFEDANKVYHHRMEELKKLVGEAKKEAFARPVAFGFPESVPIENGYPEANLPAELFVSRGAGTLRTAESAGRRYDSARRMAEALGYTSVKSYTSHTGRTAKTNYVLVGRADPRSVNSCITGVDEEKGLLFAAKGDVGRVIGTGGKNIRRIQELTGRRWRVVSE